MPTPDGDQFKKVVESTSSPANRATYTKMTHIINKDKKSSFDDDDGNHVDYGASRSVTSEYAYRPYGDERIGVSLSVDHIGPTTTTTYPKNYQHDDTWADNTAEASGQIPLFKHESTAGTSTGTYIQSTENSKVGAAILIGIADMDSRKNYGRPMVPDGNRTKHSERMVTKLAKTGGMTKTKRTSTNKLDYMPSYNHVRVQRGEVTLSATEAAQGRRRIRQMLSSPNSQQSSVVGEQLQLFDDTPYIKEDD
jgi:hypothetical protein